MLRGKALPQKGSGPTMNERIAEIRHRAERGSPRMRDSEDHSDILYLLTLVDAGEKLAEAIGLDQEIAALKLEHGKLEEQRQKAVDQTRFEDAASLRDKRIRVYETINRLLDSRPDKNAALQSWTTAMNVEKP
jgi:hypothetical protein